MAWAPIPAIPDFSVSASSALIRLEDLRNMRFNRTISTTNESSIDPGERPVIAVTEKDNSLANEYQMRLFLKQLTQSPTYVVAILFYPSDPLEQTLVHYCASELAAVRQTRTSEPFEQAPQFNPLEYSNQGWGKSREAYQRHWQAALALLAESSHLHDLVADRIFGSTKDQLGPRDYQKLLSYQVGKKTIQNFWVSQSKRNATETHI